MRCETCLLEDPASEGAPLEAFLDRLADCDECPLVHGERALGPVRLLVRKHQEAARLARKLSSKLRQREVELRQLAAGAGSDEERMAKLERLYAASVRELNEQIAVAQQREQVMLAMSTPILRVWKGVLALPVIGRLDGARAALMSAALLKAIDEQGAAYAIVDLTGVAEVDAGTADHLLRICQAAQLLGAELILTGVPGKVAQALVDLGVDLSFVITVSSVEAALRRCFAAAPARRHDSG